jgi:hypothetical protein
MSRSNYKFVVIDIMYGVCIQTSVSILCDLKGSHPDGDCEVCGVGRCSILRRSYSYRQQIKLDCETNVMQCTINAAIRLAVCGSRRCLYTCRAVSITSGEELDFHEVSGVSQS